ACGPGSLYFLSALRDERDYLMGRESFYYEGFIRQSFGFLRDTGSFSLSLTQKKQGGRDYLATEASGGVILFLATRPSGRMRFTSMTQMESKGYSSRGDYRDNSGLREDLGLELVYPFLRGDLGFVGEFRPLNGEKGLMAKPQFFFGPALLSADLSVGNKYYLTVSGEESKSFYDISVSSVFPETGFLSLLPKFYASEGKYSLNRLNSNASVGGEIGFVMRAVVAGSRWEWGLMKGIGERNFYEYQGDEQNSWAEANFSVRRDFSGGHGVYLRSRITKTGYDYPQGFLPNDRDDRTLSVVMGVLAAINSNLMAEAGFLARNQDLVFLQSERSHETRHQDRYALFGKCAWEGPLAVEFRCEISALYNTYRFNPQDNLLIRFYENVLFLKSQRFQSVTRFRLQDHGGYVGGIYYPSSYSREFWFQPSFRVFSLGATEIFLMARYYIRDEGERGDRTRTLEEEGIGLGTRKGGMLEGRVLLVKRTDEGHFWDIGLYYNPGQ
ncbi:MAG: hypothetical protein ACPL68_03360, partial [Candidatus Hydrothermia bacterium]